MSAKIDIRASWRRLRIEAQALRNYPAFLTRDFPTRRDDLLDSRIPALLYVKAIAILDDALEQQAANRGWHVKRDDLFHRIEAIPSELEVPRQELHRLRKRRHELAHESALSNWDELDSDVAVVHSALQALGLADEPSGLEFQSERSGIRQSHREGYDFERDFTYRVTEDGSVAMEWVWTEFIQGISSHQGAEG
jgi:hypothetical protein